MESQINHHSFGTHAVTTFGFLQFLICKNGNNTTNDFQVLFEGLNELLYVGCLDQHLVHNKYYNFADSKIIIVCHLDLL